jgi:cleavage and polyadenylation specificity factor subunit 1
VLQSDGLASSDPSLTDDLVDGVPVTAPDEEADEVKQMLFVPIGRGTPRPHLLVRLWHFCAIPA